MLRKYNFLISEWNCLIKTKQAPYAYISNSIAFGKEFVSRACLPHIDGLVQERRNFIVNALELRLSYINPSRLSHSLY